MRPTYCLMLLLLAAGCGPLDPFERPHTWTALGSNDANLRMMVANPDDLSSGVDQPGSLSAEAARPVSRLLSGRRAPLSVSNASQVGSAKGAPADQLAEPATAQSQ